MFVIKAVTPNKQKSAFWKRDFKLGRQLNNDKDCEPVNITVLREGIKVKTKSPSAQKTKIHRMSVKATTPALIAKAAMILQPDI